MWKGPLKLDFLDIYLTTFFGVRKFKYTKLIKAIFFSENVKNWIFIYKM